MTEKKEIPVADVEDAVLRYVREEGFKDDPERKRKHDDSTADFEQWAAGYLNTNGFNEDIYQNQEVAAAAVAAVASSKKKKQKLIVDPELAQLGEHEQLVRKAIMDADEIAQHSELQRYLNTEDDRSEFETSEGAAAAAAAVAAVSAATGSGVGAGGSGGKRRAVLPAGNSEARARDQSILVSDLVAQAADKASHWFNANTKTTSKSFTKGEAEALEKFLSDYQQIHNLTRDDICQRVWSNERRKDDFWENITKVLPHRSRASVYKHVRRVYHVFEQRGKWTHEEDVILGRLAVEKEGQWRVIGREMGRMPEDCRDRWRNYVKCGSNKNANKWSLEEEQQLKAIIAEILKDEDDKHKGAINWTVVSERMGGTRSRIQCRYKWNKLLKRDAVIRAQSVGLEDRTWLLSRLKELGISDDSQIDWDELAAENPKDYWKGSDLKLCFDKMRVTIRDHKNKKITEICDTLLRELYQNPSQA